ncbi:MAG: thiamine pyrophosphokinase [Legionellales bacterium]|nr:thiamine pyrophosphokinase [Legionellales bacterium]
MKKSVALRKFIIIANGPFLARDIIMEAIQDRQIIALDGAADTLLTLGISPHIILGDFDSIHPQTQAHWGIVQDFQTMSEQAQPYPGQHGVLIVPAKDQMFTDLSKAIQYCDQQQAEEISIICATGGREDHHEANKLSLQQSYRKYRPILLHGMHQTLRWAENEVVTLHGEIGDHCGFVAQNTGYGDSEGLRYPCIQTSVSLCNQLSAPTAYVTITGSALMIMPSPLQTQRRWLKEAGSL